MKSKSKETENLRAKLDYIGLDLDKLPECVTDFNGFQFNVSRLNNDKDHKIYKFVPIDKIEILLTPTLREDTISQKYNKAVPLYKFVEEPETEEDIERHHTFLKMVETFSIADVENITATQKNLEKTEPFKVRYPKDTLWQIYYSEEDDRYFMLVCTKESTFGEFFYLLKRKIDFAKKKIKTAPKIYVPINYLNYSEKFLSKDEITDLENYLWLFTKNWPAIFEVYSKKNDVSLQIAGDTFVYGNVKSSYKVKITEKEDAIKFYKLVKALFLLSTEIKNKYEFKTKIDSKNGLELYYKNRKIVYEVLPEFIKQEVINAQEEIKNQNDKIVILNEDYQDLKEKVQEQETEYLIKQKQISTYLDCKKTFLGKVKYFFKSSKIRDQIVAENKNTRLKSVPDAKAVSEIVLDPELRDKEYYTIEDLVTIHNILDKESRSIKNLELDIKAIELKLENYISKVKNATLYIEEIDKHKKSIFDFWKFSNKDEKLSLEMGSEKEEEKTKTKIQKVFDFDMDFEEFGNKMDAIQRKKLSIEETDSIFVAKSKVLKVINMLRHGDMDKDVLEETLKSLKEDFSKTHMHIEEEVFDIFENVENDARKIKYIGSRSHRENEKNIYKILNVNKKIDVFDFTEKIQSVITYLEGAIPKITNTTDMSIYKVCSITEKILKDSFDVYDINIESALSNFEDNFEAAVNLVKLNVKAKMPILFYTNIIFYDNNNQTLPEGMNLSSNVLIDTKKFEFKLVSKTKFRTNNYFSESNNLLTPKSKDIFVYEYDVIDKNSISEEELERIKLAETLEQTEIQDSDNLMDEEIEEYEETEDIDVLEESDDVEEVEEYEDEIDEPEEEKIEEDEVEEEEELEGEYSDEEFEKELEEAQTKKVEVKKEEPKKEPEPEYDDEEFEAEIIDPLQSKIDILRGGIDRSKLEKSIASEIKDKKNKRLKEKGIMPKEEKEPVILENAMEINIPKKKKNRISNEDYLYEEEQITEADILEDIDDEAMAKLKKKSKKKK
ncbi:MAG: hypothetical protein IKN74_04260 [Clostridia bacterium]|nr:hypothetical protein [Clostridia bacterium]